MRIKISVEDNEFLKGLHDWAWNTPSIDEFWDGILTGKEWREQVIEINKVPEGLLKEYLFLKIRAGIGNPIIKAHHKENGRMVTCDIRDFETYVKYAKKYK